jgi:tRNA(adenine34) deaminase
MEQGISYLRPPTDEDHMRQALDEARAAAAAGEVPVGAVAVHEDRIIARAHNQREKLQDPTAHAEMLILTQAAAALQSWRLAGVTLYVTLEPCTMCAGALVLARIDRLVFGAPDPKAGACGSLWDVPGDRRLNHRFPVTAGVLADECSDVLRAWFQERRGAKR